MNSKAHVNNAKQSVVVKMDMRKLSLYSRSKTKNKATEREVYALHFDERNRSNLHNTVRPFTDDSHLSDMDDPRMLYGIHVHTPCNVHCTDLWLSFTNKWMQGRFYEILLHVLCPFAIAIHDFDYRNLRDRVDAYYKESRCFVSLNPFEDTLRNVLELVESTQYSTNVSNIGLSRAYFITHIIKGLTVDTRRAKGARRALKPYIDMTLDVLCGVPKHILNACRMQPTMHHTVLAQIEAKLTITTLDQYIVDMSNTLQTICPSLKANLRLTRFDEFESISNASVLYNACEIYSEIVNMDVRCNDHAYIAHMNCYFHGHCKIQCPFEAMEGNNGDNATQCKFAECTEQDVPYDCHMAVFEHQQNTTTRETRVNKVSSSFRPFAFQIRREIKNWFAVRVSSGDSGFNNAMDSFTI